MTTLLPVATAAESRSELFGLLRRHRAEAAVCIVMLLTATAVGLLVPPLLGALIDAALDERRGRIDLLVAALAAATAVSAALTGAATALVAGLGERMLAELREGVVERVLQLPSGQVEAAGTGDLLARVGPDVDAISLSFRDGVPTLLFAGLNVAMTGIGLLALDWRFVVAGALAVPLQVIAARHYLRRSRPLFAAERVAVSGQTQELHDALRGARDLRARGEEDAAGRRVEAASGEALRRSIRSSRAGSDYGAQLNGAELAALAGVLVVGFHLVRADAVSVGVATAAALYVHRLFSPVMSLLGLIDTIQDATASLARLVGVVRLPAPALATGGPPDGQVLALRDVTAAYDHGAPVLHGVTLVLRPGEQVAIVGFSGAGKSTLAKVAAAFHEASAGTVAYGGRQPSELGADAWRREIVLVSQEIHVFAGPLADDLRLADPSASPEALEQALERVGAGAWVHMLPSGLDTVVGDGGHRLTPVQAQQLALARVVLADPRVVLLDEATAEAGSTGAEQLEASARAASEGRSAVIIAHRLSHATTADRIIVLDQGRIVEQGTHTALIAAGGIYAELWSTWSSGR